MPGNELATRTVDAMESPSFGLSLGAYRRSIEIKNNTKLAALKIQGHAIIGALAMAATLRLDDERQHLLGDQLDPRHMLRAELLAKIEVAAVACMLNVQARMYNGGW